VSCLSLKKLKVMRKDLLDSSLPACQHLSHIQQLQQLISNLCWHISASMHTEERLHGGLFSS
jgi:16S rRNA A1518/A1519 N6-dimethyltransferase RsmA/KsgA/DIM1 with predicted DNA glycosylase/AP lyase activity